MAKSQHHENLRRQARPRAVKMARLHDAGKTWAEIGALFGVSRQRAYALAKAHAA